MGRIGTRGVNTALFILSCFLAAHIINQFSAAALAPESPSVRSEHPPQTPASERTPAGSAILERNLFGARVVHDEPEPPAPEDKLEQTKLPLILLGTIASEDQTVASAAIQDESTKKYEVVQVNDHLTSYTAVEVLRIERRRVILQNGQWREELRLDEDRTPQLARAPTPPKRPARTSRRRGRNLKRNELKKRLQGLASQAGARSPAAIFSQARILPKYEEGRMVGIELSKIKPDSFYEKVGFQDGDVVTQLNGMTIDDPSATRQALEAFTSAENMNVTVMRPGGQTRQIVVTPDMLTNARVEATGIGE